MELWTQAIDSKGSTVSQFHSFTKRHGGWGSKCMGGWVNNSEQGTKGTREQRAEKPATERPGGGGGVERQGGGGKAGNKPPQRRRPVAGGPGRDQGNREQGTEKKLLAPGFWPLACLAESVSREYRNERAKRLKAAFGSWLPVLRAETAALLASLFPRSLGPLAPRSLIPSVPPFWSLFACSLGPLVPVSIIGTSMRQGGVMIGKLVGD